VFAVAVSTNTIVRWLGGPSSEFLKGEPRVRNQALFLHLLEQVSAQWVISSTDIFVPALLLSFLQSHLLLRRAHC